MGEEQEICLVGNKRKTELQFIAKRLVDFTKDFEKLSDEEKKYVIERVDKLYRYGLVELYNVMGKYME